jgi:hypothetical protein
LNESLTNTSRKAGREAQRRRSAKVVELFYKSFIKAFRKFTWFYKSSTSTNREPRRLGWGAVCLRRSVEEKREKEKKKKRGKEKRGRRERGMEKGNMK